MVAVSRVSEYESADVDGAARQLRERGLDPSAVSLACALGHHRECDGTVDVLRDPGTTAARCTCPDPGHPKGHD